MLTSCRRKIFSAKIWTVGLNVSTLWISNMALHSIDQRSMQKRLAGWVYGPSILGLTPRYPSDLQDYFWLGSIIYQPIQRRQVWIVYPYWIGIHRLSSRLNPCLRWFLIARPKTSFVINIHKVPRHWSIISAWIQLKKTFLQIVTLLQAFC